MASRRRTPGPAVAVERMEAAVLTSAPVGDRYFVLHFEADEQSPVDAFWSVTTYDADGSTVPNELDPRRP